MTPSGKSTEVMTVEVEYKDLFITSVGSDMWGMRTKDSDLDLMRTYQADTKSILSGRSVKYTIPDRTYTDKNMGLVDEKAQEIGHLVNKLIDGNINAIWTVCSPLVVKNHPYLDTLRKITTQNLSKASYRSLNGMAISQLKDHIRRAGVMPEGKALKTAYRTCAFGIEMLTDGTLPFRPVEFQPTELFVQEALELLRVSYEKSPLPEYPDPAPFRGFILKARLEELGEI
jgi:predicted nucleotidyltransferase